jgi:hypothetical protein
MAKRKVEKVFDKYGFYIGDRITETRTIRRKVKASKKTYTEADRREDSLRLARALEETWEQAKKTGGDVRVSRSGVSVAPYRADRKVFY